MDVLQLILPPHLQLKQAVHQFFFGQVFQITDMDLLALIARSFRTQN